MVSKAASTGSMQDGHVKDLINQSSIQSLWYECIHGNILSCSPTLKSPIHITHLQQKQWTLLKLLNNIYVHVLQVP